MCHTPHNNGVTVPPSPLTLSPDLFTKLYSHIRSSAVATFYLIRSAFSGLIYLAAVYAERIKSSEHTAIPLQIGSMINCRFVYSTVPFTEGRQVCHSKAKLGVSGYYRRTSAMDKFVVRGSVCITLKRLHR
ncbi:hypothetical protein J6590_074849 [Homalodisca vitripennis]|nr:hypothetical protein J6590_074849 [Homalodisca vitripennis]